MITISLCMIVKNEEEILKRCLDSVADLMDEIIIVDTGSVDKTREIAAQYTDKIYDYAWKNDFSAARNFAFSKAGGDYVYSADADEVLDEENRKRFALLKEILLPEIEIVQMKYANQLCHGTVYNFDEEYRPKLFKRLREFCWIEPIHEMVRLDPVVYDSDIVIMHMPTGEHGSRDLRVFRSLTEKGEPMSQRLREMYARELLMVGSREELLAAEEYFTALCEKTQYSAEEGMIYYSVLVHIAGEKQDAALMMKYALKAAVTQCSSEICLSVGEFYEGLGDYEEALVWFYNAAFETEPILVRTMGNETPLEGLIRLCNRLGMEEQAFGYQKELELRMKEGKADAQRPQNGE